MVFDINKKSIEFNYKDSKKKISSLKDIINDKKNIYLIESVSGREKDIEKAYKLRKIIINNDNIFDYDLSKKIQYIDKNEINNIINKSNTYFLSRDAFIEYYNILYNKKIENEKDIKKIKDKIKQPKYIKHIFPAYKLKSKEKGKEGYFYSLEEMELFDIVIEYFELEMSKLKDILYSENNNYYNIINAKIKCFYKNIQNYKSVNNDKMIYYDYKLYFIPFFIFDNFKQGKITEKEHNELIRIYRKFYKSLKKIKKEKKEYSYMKFKLENKETFYKKNLIKIFEVFSYEDYKNDSYLEEYIQLHKELIEYQIKYNRYIEYYNKFFNDYIINFLYFTDRISNDDFLYFKKHIEELKNINNENNDKYINLTEKDENIIYETIIKNNHKKVIIGYIELYNFNKLYHKSSKKHYKRSIELISGYNFFKKILK
ncbi:hypothetical protein [Brachyspira hyodysenteriae]|uniref:hypothetical protein n=1 Tax=Brachyspira hyodysenteriae TaxID=159 RepID=UPI00063D9B03|nr:hypothetical protein [Brachyspira hyodysenteriae]KLI20136.1 hypothetical protein SU46_04760 [Brachyspira hyodysenteriae]KLI38801.1 hypothetical protein SZ51_06715 [Brachyspira hyodysenteriae]KLI41964.1 hypothetical protein SZ52_07605 [Brachyspira hyodysenteriae]MCZ9886126.1 hypothetical protein [Brachyspira hyodysenteriae]